MICKKSNPFFKGFSFTVVFLILIIIIVNYFVDPLRFKAERVNNFNYLLAKDVNGALPVNNLFSLYYRGSKVKYSIIGTSNVFYGISVCNYPNVEKIAQSSMNVRETSQVLKKVIENALVEKMIFVEITNQDELGWRDVGYLETLLSFRTFAFSLKTLNANMFANDISSTYSLCSPPEVALATATSVDELNKKRDPIRSITNSDLGAIKKIITGKYDIKKGLKHQVVFFMSPLPQETVQQEKYIAINNKIKRSLNELIISQKHINNNVDFSYINFNDLKIGSEYQFNKDNFYEGWYDASHFKPVVGNQVLKYILSIAKYN